MVKTAGSMLLDKKRRAASIKYTRPSEQTNSIFTGLIDVNNVVNQMYPRGCSLYFHLEDFLTRAIALM